MCHSWGKFSTNTISNCCCFFDLRNDPDFFICLPWVEFDIYGSNSLSPFSVTKLCVTADLQPTGRHLLVSTKSHSFQQSNKQGKKHWKYNMVGEMCDIHLQQNHKYSFFYHSKSVVSSTKPPYKMYKWIGWDGIGSVICYLKIKIMVGW